MLIYFKFIKEEYLFFNFLFWYGVFVFKKCLVLMFKSYIVKKFLLEEIVLFFILMCLNEFYFGYIIIIFIIINFELRYLLNLVC